MLAGVGDVCARHWLPFVYNTNMLDTFTEVPVFVAVVEGGSFAAASRRLNLSRSAVGKAVARLEGRLLVRLFHRTTRSQSLTEDGQAFYEHCQRALNELQAGKALLDSGRRTVSGKLRVSVPVLFGRLCVAPVLTRLALAHPGLELDLSFSDRIVDLFEDGFDLAVRNGPLGGGSGLMARRIAREQTMIFASPGYLERHGVPDKLDDLRRHWAITYGRSGRVQRWLFPRDGAAPAAADIPTRLRFDDLDAIAEAAACGVGLAWLPDWLVRGKVQSGQLVPVLANIPALVSDVHAIWPETPYLPTRVRVAIDTLAAEVPDARSGLRALDGS